MKTPRRIILFILLLAALALAASALAQFDASQAVGYDISWYTIDGGGGSASGGAYALNGTLGQPDAALLSSGGFALTGGFWTGAETTQQIFLPVVSR